MWSDAPRLARQQKVVRTGSEQRCGVQHHPTGRCLVPLVGCLLLEAAGGCWMLLEAVGGCFVQLRAASTQLSTVDAQTSVKQVPVDTLS